MTVSLVLAILASLFVSWMIGANSVATSFGPVAGTGVGGVLRGALLAGIFGLIGAVVQGNTVAGTVGSDLLVGTGVSTVMGSIILLTAAFLVITGVLFHIPIPIAFTVVGGVLGVGLGLGDPLNIAKVRIIAATWILIPFVALGLGYAFARILRSAVSRGSKRLLNTILFFIAAFCAYTAGANLVGLAIGPIITSVSLSLRLMLLMGGVVILFGAWIGGPRIVSAVSKDYSEMGVRRSICALATATLIAQTATVFGIPVSFNEAIIASMIGSGLVVEASGVQLEKIGMTVGSWITSFFASLGIASAAAFFFLA